MAATRSQCARAPKGLAAKRASHAFMWLAFGESNPQSNAHSETDGFPGIVQPQQVETEALKIIIGLGFDFPDVLLYLHQFKGKALKDVVLSGDPMPVHRYGPEHLHFLT